jgi:hypothetical protein
MATPIQVFSRIQKNHCAVAFIMVHNHTETQYYNYNINDMPDRNWINLSQLGCLGLGVLKLEAVIHPVNF